MTTYLALENSSVTAWGLTQSDLQARHPNTSFPQPLTPADVADLGYLPIAPSERPSINHHTERLVEVAPMFDDVSNQWVQQWRVEALPAESVAASLASRKTSLPSQIDAEVDAVISAVIGNRAQEYELAEREALAFISDNCPADNVPKSVQSDADANNQTAKWSADRIVATAAAWRSAQADLRHQRLAHKSKAKAATTHDQLDAVQESWRVEIQRIRAGLL